MPSRVAVAYQGSGLSVEVLLSIAYALAEGRRRGLVENSDSGAGASCDVHAVKASVVIGSA